MYIHACVIYRVTKIKPIFGDFFFILLFLFYKKNELNFNFKTVNYFFQLFTILLFTVNVEHKQLIST